MLPFLLVQIYPIIRMEHHKGLFPCLGMNKMPAPTPRFAFHMGRADIPNLYIINFFNRLPNLKFVGLRIHFKSINISNIGKMNTLFRNHRPNYNAVFLHGSTPLIQRTLAIYNRQKSIFGKKHLLFAADVAGV